MVYHHITELIGNTPLLKIDPAIHGLKNIEIYAKLEYFNPFGSVKDRPAWEMIRDDIEDIQKNKKKIIESSSGNTAKALALLASIYGIPFKTITNRMKVIEQKQLLKVLGAEIEELPGSSDCYDPMNPHDPFFYLQEEVRTQGDAVFFPSQYTNEKNLRAHEQGTGEEIVQDLPRVDYLFGGLGTTGSTAGTAKRIRQRDPGLAVIGICARTQDHLPGVRNQDEMWEVGLFQKELYHSIEFVSSREAVNGMLELATRSGVLGGPTSGACYAGMLEYLRNIDATLTEKKTAVFIVCDRFEPYLSYLRERVPERFRENAVVHQMDEGLLDSTEPVPSISAVSAPEWIAKEKPLIIDMRGHQVFHIGHVPGSINVPEALLRSLMNSFRPFPQDRPILLVCPQGERSKVFTHVLRKKGYQAFQLEGGLWKWRAAGLSLETIDCCESPQS